MASFTTEDAAEVSALRAQVAELQAQLAQCRELPTVLKRTDQFLCKHLPRTDIGAGLFSADWQLAIFASVTFKRIFGLSQADLQADPKRWMQLIDKEDLPQVEAAISAAQPGKATESRKVETLLIASWGTSRPAILADWSARKFQPVTDVSPGVPGA